jgi:redox-sensitive bicupin YhaK (pirin superfamily)
VIKIIPAAQRHYADHGWLKTNWLFSFSDYYDPQNVDFGTVRVFNDDIILPHNGFGTHAHHDMEIVTVMRAGAITHRDSMGTKAVINAGEIQRMSAGSGVTHSEHNLGDVPVHLYQVWFPPRHINAKPSYEQKAFANADASAPALNALEPLVSGFGHANALSIDSDAMMGQAFLQAGHTLTIPLAPGRGLFLYPASGAMTVNGKALGALDQGRISQEREVTLVAQQDATLIAIEVIGV